MARSSFFAECKKFIPRVNGMGNYILKPIVRWLVIAPVQQVVMIF